MRGTNREAGEQHCPRGLLIAGLECLSTCIFGGRLRVNRGVHVDV